MKILYAFVCLSFLAPSMLYSQCISPPPVPAASGSDIAVTDNETINAASTRWYSGPAHSLNSLTLSGGTLVVAGDLTVDKFYMTEGVIFIQPGARFVIGSGIGAGLQLQGNCAIYNYGTLEVQRNLSLESGHASSSQPNLLINALNTSVFTMSNQYLVINNADSRFVNNGQAEAWGIITDAQSTKNAVCLGNNSSTKMAVLINKVPDSYTVPVGTACVHVFQFSQFFGRLTGDKGLLACLPATHHSDSGCIPFGCHPNDWGEAQVFSNCNGCGSLLLLSVQFSSITAMPNRYGGNVINWKLSAAAPGGRFRILHSRNGSDFSIIDSLTAVTNGETAYQYNDNHPVPGLNFYRVDYAGADGRYQRSQIVRAVTAGLHQLVIYPVPFRQELFVRCPDSFRAEKIVVTDVAGRTIPARFTMQENRRLITIHFFREPTAGVYLVHVQTDGAVFSQTIIKQ